MSSCSIYANEQIAKYFSYQMHPGGLELLQKALPSLPLPAQANVLDIGCGYGETLAFLQENYAIQAIGLEKEQAILQVAQKKHPKVQFLQVDLQDSPFPVSNQDCIIAECIFSLLDKPKTVIEASFHALKPDGFLYISDLYFTQEGNYPAHFLTHTEWQKMLQACGFTLHSFTDHKKELTQFLIKIIMAGAQKEDFCPDFLQYKNISYCSIIAKKERRL